LLIVNGQLLMGSPGTLTSLTFAPLTINPSTIDN
jgi:hypothetical protein